MANLDLIETSRHILRIHNVKNIQSNVLTTDILSRSCCNLWMTGTKHTKNIQDPQISILKKQFTKFVNQNYKNPIVCLEGFLPNDLGNEKTSVEKNVEKAILILMAKKLEIKIISVEPTQEEISEWAMQLFHDPLAHAAWAILNVLTNSPEILRTALPIITSTYHFRGGPKKFFLKISEYLRQENIVNLPSNLEQLTITPINKNKIKKAQKPGRGPYPTNQAGMYINLARDYGLFRNTVHAMNKNKSDGTFAWYGLNHVNSIIPAFTHSGFDKKHLSISE